MAGGFRVVVIRSTSKLDYQFGRMKVRTKDEAKEIFLDEISVLLIEDTSVSLTAYLLNELVRRNIKVIFCDEKRNPAAELVNIYGSFDSSKKIALQTAWNEKAKAKVWQMIVRTKIENQAKLLSRIKKEEKAKMLFDYAKEVQEGDASNREGMAAKVYFTALFGQGFKRDDDKNIKNVLLNYGYTIFNSVFNREVVAAGYLTQLGLWHRGGQNPFNLSSDLMEPFRPIVDEYVFNSKTEVFEWDVKAELIDLLNKKIFIAGAEQTFLNAAQIYVLGALAAVEEEDVSKLKAFEPFRE